LLFLISLVGWVLTNLHTRQLRVLPMKKIIYFIITLQFVIALQGIGHAFDSKKLEKTLYNQSKAKYGHFTLPPLDENVSETARHYKIRFSIEPSFDNQISYEFLINYYGYKSAAEEKNAAKYLDLKNVLFRKYEISNASKEVIENCYKKISLAKDQVIKKYPPIDNLDKKTKEKFYNEYNKAIKAVEEPRQLILTIHEALITDIILPRFSGHS
jgi:hypothetical protein